MLSKLLENYLTGVPYAYLKEGFTTDKVSSLFSYLHGVKKPPLWSAASQYALVSLAGATLGGWYLGKITSRHHSHVTSRQVDFIQSTNARGDGTAGI